VRSASDIRKLRPVPEGRTANCSARLKPAGSSPAAAQVTVDVLPTRTSRSHACPAGAAAVWLGGTCVPSQSASLMREPAVAAARLFGTAITALEPGGSKQACLTRRRRKVGRRCGNSEPAVTRIDLIGITHGQTGRFHNFGPLYEQDGADHGERATGSACACATPPGRRPSSPPGRKAALRSDSRSGAWSPGRSGPRSPDPRPDHPWPFRLA